MKEKKESHVWVKTAWSRVILAVAPKIRSFWSKHNFIIRFSVTSMMAKSFESLTPKQLSKYDTPWYFDETHELFLSSEEDEEKNVSFGKIVKVDIGTVERAGEKVVVVVFFTAAKKAIGLNWRKMLKFHDEAHSRLQGLSTPSNLVTSFGSLSFFFLLHFTCHKQFPAFSVHEENFVFLLDLFIIMNDPWRSKLILTLICLEAIALELGLSRGIPDWFKKQGALFRVFRPLGREANRSQSRIWNFQEEKAGWYGLS